VLRLSDARNFRRTAAGLALIIGPILLLVSSAITTTGGGDNTREYLADVADNRSGEEISAVLTILGFAILIPGIIGALNLLRGRGVVLGHIGGALAVLGLACFPALIATSFVDVAATEPGAASQEYVDIVERVEDQAGAIIIVAIALLGTLVGFILLAAAFLRARTVPVWVGPLIILGIVVTFPAESRVLQVLGSALLLVAFGAIGLQLLRQPDEEWEQLRLAGSRPEGPAGGPGPG
jgi:hypothetical protein